MVSGIRKVRGTESLPRAIAVGASAGASAPTAGVAGRQSPHRNSFHCGWQGATKGVAIRTRLPEVGSGVHDELAAIGADVSVSSSVRANSREISALAFDYSGTAQNPPPRSPR